MELKSDEESLGEARFLKPSGMDRSDRSVSDDAVEKASSSNVEVAIYGILRKERLKRCRGGRYDQGAGGSCMCGFHGASGLGGVPSDGKYSLSK